MTQEQQTKLEGLSEEYANGFKNLFAITKSNLKTILDNYHDYGLQSMEKYKDMVQANVRLGAENQRLREALESIATRWNKVAEHNEMRTALHLIQQDVFEALKNNK